MAMVAGYGLAEAYVTRKIYMEKMKNREQDEEKITEIKNPKIKAGSEDKASSGCFSWLPKQHHKKNCRISDYNINDTKANK
ncbi:hypothetical protein RJT34_12133 [Clitoria ternatea]|uniref:Uncharacterized protein n=1 Tax=Clitoria ternatea TaxID=43366 RepID=A0AAN9JLB6_CLITE